MSKLEELIEELCPNGVKLKKIEECADYTQPSKFIVSDTNYVDEGIPVLTPGQSFILGYTTDEEGIFEASKENPIILFDDFTGSLQWVDFPFKVKSSACKIITSKKDVNIRYLYHLMANLNFRSDEHKRLWISIYSQFEVPIPPLPVQEEIVRILDNFTDLTAELQAELQARAKQYEYYRNTLLSRDESVSMRTIGSLCKVSAGGDAPKDAMAKDKTDEYTIPIISNGVGENALYGYTNQAKITEPAVTVAARGTIGYAEYRDYPYVPIIRLLSLIPNNTEELDTKFLYYCLQGKEYNVPTTGIPQLTAPMVKQVEIPLPGIEVQRKIVGILDNFEIICNDISEGLPAEIEARQKQYEYYRNKILTFKELG